MATGVKPPAWFWIVAILLVLWEAIGCYACVEQFRLGAAAMGPVDAWSQAYYDALPTWYNYVYVVATFGGLLGGLALLLRERRATILFWISLIAVIVMFGYAFAATDLIAHKGLGNVVIFPAVIALIAVFSVWFSGWRRKRAGSAHGSLGGRASALPLEHFVERLAEHLGDAERGFERGRVFPRLDRSDRLAGHADAVAQLGLGHLARHETQ